MNRVAKTWIDFIETAQLPEDYQLIVNVIGLENAIKLAQALPSIYTYLVNPKKVFKPARSNTSLIAIPRPARKALSITVV